MLSKTRLALVFFIAILIVSALGTVELQSVYGSSYTIYTHKLSTKPTHYFVLENADVYILKAISTQKYVDVGSPNNTQLDDLVNAHLGQDLEYNGSYYGAGYFFKTSSPPVIPFLTILAEIVISGTGIAVISFESVHAKRKSICEENALSI